MNSLKQFIIPILLGSLMITSIYGCVMVLVVSESVDELEENDKHIMELLESNNLNQPDSMPKLTDSIAYYKSEKKSWVTVHRFFFKRAEYTDKLYGGFSIIVAEFDTKKILVENQENVTLSTSNLGEPLDKWETTLNVLTADRKPYIDFSDDGLKTRTFIRSNKF